MAFNPDQFKPKKKRAVDPNAPPRPNLMSHDKKIRESQVAFDRLVAQVQHQQEEIASLKTKYISMQSSIDQLVSYLRRNK